MGRKRIGERLKEVNVLPAENPNYVIVNGLKIHFKSAGIAGLVESYCMIYADGIAENCTVVSGKDRLDLLELLKFASTLKDTDIKTSTYSALAKELYFKIK